MAQEESSDEIDDAVNTLIEQWPQFFQKVISEFEIWTGKRAKGLPDKVDSKSLYRKFRNLATVVKQLEIVRNEPLTPKSAARILLLFNRMIRLSVPRIPRNKEPLEYLIQEVRRQSEIPPGFVLPQGLDYKTKHTGLQEFICELVGLVGECELDAFLQEAFTQRQLVAQFQRLFAKMALPKELKRLPSKVSRESAERLKLALREVTSDWGAFINLLYGLILLKRGEQSTWASIRRVSLWDKVLAVRNDRRLVALAKQEWVTVRNSLDHGRAFFDPAKESIEFPDRTRKISWHIEQAFLEGIDIYLANSTVLRTWNFVYAARMEPFEAQVMALKKITSGDTS